METCRITFYRIDRCGYYSRNATEAEFCEIEDALEELKAWAFQTGMTLGQTCTFSPDDYNENLSETYCFDLVNNNQEDYLLVTWNRVPSIGGQVASVPSLEAVGEAQVSLTELPDGSIPGYATYFWFIPSRNVFACLQFHHRMNGRRNLEKYLREFLAKATEHVVRDNDEIVGYIKDINDTARKLYPQFNSLLHRNQAPINYIRAQRENIRKIIRKDELDLDIHRDRKWWQVMLGGLGVSKQNRTINTEVKFRFEVNHCPSQAELEDIIATWNNETLHTKWDDTGFQLEGESNIRWLSYSLARKEIELDVLRDNEEVVNSESLLEKLLEQRDSLLELIQ